MDNATPTPDVLDCEGYRTLLAKVVKDESQSKAHNYRAKLAWIVARARHYAEKTGLKAEDILDSWEKKCDYWYMNYYQDCNQPEIKTGSVRVFETCDELKTAIGQAGFRCPACGGVSKSPYECTTGIVINKKPCDWKVYRLFGHLGKGITVYVKEKMNANAIFMPIAWENNAP